MNWHAIRAIYLFELARTWRTLLQSIATPVISTSSSSGMVSDDSGAQTSARTTSSPPTRNAAFPDITR